MTDPARPSPQALIAAARDGLSAPAPLDPPAWDRLQDRARVALWRAGERLAVAEGPAQTTADASPTDDPLTAVRAAAAAAAAALPDGLPDPGNIFIDIELVDTVEPLTPAGLSGLLFGFEPGLHGLALQEQPRAAGGWPADALLSAGGPARWAKAILRHVHPPGTRLPPSVGVRRFTTRQVLGPWVPPTDDAAAPKDGEPPQATPLQAGTRLVPAQAVAADPLVRAATLAGAWLIRHQRPGGFFRYEFLERTHEWSAADSLVRQAGCAWAVATLARVAPQAGFTQPALHAIHGIAGATLKRGGPGNLAYLQAPGGRPSLGAMPLLLLAADEFASPSAGGPHRGSPLDAAARDGIIATLLAVQTREGAFGARARGLELEGSEIYYAGQIALALARRYALSKRDRLATAGLRSLRYYRQWWDAGNANLSFATWMLQACDAWHALRDDDTARDFCFQMADWALQFQHPQDHPNPLWVGAFERTPGIGTAAYTEGMIRALALARRVGDQDRARRYEESVRLAMRFLLSLTMQEVDLVYVGGREHLGAVRSSLQRRNLRCDNAQHFARAALAAATELFRAET